MVLNCAGETRKRDVTTMFTYSHANTPLGQSERAYYLSYFIMFNSGMDALPTAVETSAKVVLNLAHAFTHYMHYVCKKYEAAKLIISELVSILISALHSELVGWVFWIKLAVRTI